MADVRYRVDIDTKGATNAINRLGSTIKTIGASIAGAFAFKEFTQTGAKLDDLRRTFQTLYRSVEDGSKAFSDTQVLAQKFGLGIEDLSKVVIKLKSAGIEPTIAQLQLFSDVSKSSVDSVGALQAITDLFTRTMAGGLGLEDLERLQDRGIPVYTILAQKAGLARTQISELGQTMEGAARIRGILAEGLNEMFGGATASRADSMSTAFTNLSNAVKKTVDTITQGGVGQGFAEIVNGIAGWINANQVLIQQIATGFIKAIGYAIQYLEEIIKLLAAFAAVAVTQRIIAMAEAVFLFVKGLRGLAVGAAAVQSITGAGIIKVLAGLAAAGGAVIAIDKMFEDAQSSATGLNTALEDLKSTTVDVGDLQLFQPGSIEPVNKDFSDLNDSLKEFKIEQESIARNFAIANSERRQSINLETELLGKSREYGELRRSEADLTRSLQHEIQQLQEAKAKLTAEELKEGRDKIIEKTIAAMREQYEVDLQLTQAAIKNSEARKRAYELEQYAIKEGLRAQQAQTSIADAKARLTMNSLERSLRDIEDAARDSADEQVRALEASLGRKATEQEIAEIYRIANENTEILKEQQKDLYDESRRFSTGWKKAYKDYAEDASNAARTAERVFSKATQGMEDAIVDFVKTGKFEWRDFLSSIVEELLRSQIRQLIASTFGGIFTPGGGIGGGLGSIFSGIGSLFGFANGGMIPNNSPVLVGERGPELLMNAGGSRVIPNGELGTNVNYYIQAVDARSFQQLVAQDPGFIYSVTERGRRNLPSTRR